MVVHGYAELFPGIRNVARHRDILPTGGAVPAGMVVDKNNRCRAKVHRAADDFAGVNGGLVDGTLACHLVADQHVLAVQIQRAHALNRQMRHIGAQIIEQRLPRRQDRQLAHGFAEQAKRRHLDYLQRRNAGFAHPFFLQDTVGVCGQQGR